jgi:hypothetical protein
MSRRSDARNLHQREGIDATEEGGATIAAFRLLLAEGVTLPAPVLLFNTATSLKYVPRSLLCHADSELVT